MATILTKKSDTSSSVPLAADLTNAAGGAELAVNTADKRLYSKTSGGSVVELGTNPSALSLPNGTANGVPYLNGSKVLTSGSALQFDGSNLGLGVTPSAWSLGKAIEVNNVGNALWGVAASEIDVSQNAYYNSGWKYASSSYASRYEQNTGVHKWYTAPSGTAGNAISFTQAMTLGSDNRLLLNTTSNPNSARLYVADSGGYLMNLHQAATGATGCDLLFTHAGDSNKASIKLTGDTNGSALAFETGTGPTERARIDSSGNLLVGTTSKSGLFTGDVVNTGCVIEAAGGSFARQRNNDAPIYLSKASGYTNGTMIIFYVAGNPVGTISVTGSATSYNTSSDYRLKTVIGAVSGAGQRIDALEPIEYEWKVNGERTRGFLAHKFQEVYAGSVTGTKDAVDAEGKPIYQAMQASSSEVIADLVAELQSLRKRLAALESK